MVISNAYLMIFAVAMMGCVLATPLVTRIAAWVGAIDRPDQFRRIHKGAIPRLGGLGLAFGHRRGRGRAPRLGGYLALIGPSLPDLVATSGPILVAALIILVVGFVDDTRVDRPARQAAGPGGRPCWSLYLGGIRIQTIDVLGLSLDLGHPASQFGAAGLRRSTWRCPAWSSRCSGSWAA